MVLQSRFLTTIQATLLKLLAHGHQLANLQRSIQQT